ncbi:hypothetical protein HAX54_048357 [Datura stramonium]|uniref:Uncharacterized protein n=1 Tax=Datura stramonium TaxID=4076 RepID=A0ABS8WN19_DATST|nr:hypothetical protein [Datura stramonium]
MESTMAQTEKVAEEEEDWGNCLVAETRAVNVMTSINYERDWIMNSRSDNTVHHVKKEVNLVINKKQEHYDNVQTDDVVPAVKEIKETNFETDNISLDMDDVELELEETMSETIYANGDHFEGNIKGDVEEVEVSGQSSSILKIIIGLEKILKADEEAKYQIDVEVDHEDLISDGETDSMIFEIFEAAKQSIEQLKKDSSSGSKASQEFGGQIITNIDEKADTCVSPDSIIWELREGGV